jgi:cobalt/nickel transport system permease protein
MILALIISINLTPPRAWPAYILYLTLVISIALLSRIDIKLFLKRSLIAIPFLFAALPLIFINSSQNQLHFFDIFHIPFNQDGFFRFISIAIKSWISVMAAVLLTAATRFEDILTAMEQLKVPKILLVIIGLMWRYLFLIADEVTRMLRARASRSGCSLNKGRRSSLCWRARVTGGMAGNLFLRSIERSDRVYAAMLSRGYTGKPPTTEISPLSRTDIRILISGFFLMVSLWLLGVITGG